MHGLHAGLCRLGWVALLLSSEPAASKPCASLGSSWQSKGICSLMVLVLLGGHQWEVEDAT